MLPGRLNGTRDDRLILIGSHYDTIRTTSQGVDDNGSGVVALLQIARLLTSKRFGKQNRIYYHNMKSKLLSSN
jgi:Zn-dependent M28 family amino/carboxypeptidase